MKTSGVLDRIVDKKYATILVEEINQQFTVDINELPTNSNEGDWFDLEIVGGKITNIKLNESLTKERRKNIADKMDRLKKRSRSKFKKN